MKEKGPLADVMGCIEAHLTLGPSNNHQPHTRPHATGNVAQQARTVTPKLIPQGC